jgi:hypothetical protein
MDIPTRIMASLPVASALAIALPALAQSGAAALPEEWDALTKEAGAACQIASELENSRVLWSNPAYEHTVAIIVTGESKQPDLKGDDSMLCLFDKQTAKVEIQELDPKLFE